MNSVCGFFIARQRKDIALSLLDEFYLNRENFTEYGFGAFEPQTIDRSGIFDETKKPPQKVKD
jgi:hypothetical protein